MRTPQRMRCRHAALRALATTGLVALAAATLASRGASAAPAPDLPLEIATVDTSQHPRVGAVLRAPSQLQGIALPADAFAVEEGGERRSVTVERLPSAGLEVVLAIDTSGSMTGRPLASAKTAAQQFVSTLPADARIAVVAFGASAQVVADFATSRADATARIGSLRARGETAVYDAVIKATGLFTTGASRRVLALVADGGDTVSKQPLTAAARTLAENHVGVYAVSLETPESDLASLRALAASGQGRVVPAADPVALSAVFRQLADQVTNEYRVSWTATHGGTNRIVTTITANGLVYRAERTVDYPPLAAPPPGVQPVAPGPARAPSPARVPAAQSTRLLYLGLTASFLALAIVAGIALVPGRPVRRLAREWLPDVRDRDVTALTRRAAAFSERVLVRAGQAGRLTQLLERAAIAMPAGQAALLGAVTAAVAFLFGAVLAGLVTGVGLAALSVCGLVGFLHLRADRRRVRFAEQFESTLQLLSGSLRAGYGLNQALDTIGRESESPTSEEFRRVTLETRLGKDQIVALREAADRVQSTDLEWVVDAMEINREIGGNLSEVLHNVAGTIRERTRLGRQVRSLSAEGRVSAAILLALPPAMFVWMRITNPPYIHELTGSTKGQVLLAAGIGLLLVGLVWMRKIVRIEY